MTNCEKLRVAVVEYLDSFYIADSQGDSIPWPETLANLVGWQVID
jgi:hypothetical protein